MKHSIRNSRLFQKTVHGFLEKAELLCCGYDRVRARSITACRYRGSTEVGFSFPPFVPLSCLLNGPKLSATDF